MNAELSRRPDYAVEPGPGQESVWDYPRPPAISHDNRRIEIRDGATVIARATGSYKVMETASPPTYYLARDDVSFHSLVRIEHQTYCEWKGVASYWALARKPEDPVGWSYERPRSRFDRVRDFVAFYPGRVECFLGGERVRAQAGRFYGGWITSEIVGPFKGEPGTVGW